MTDGILRTRDELNSFATSCYGIVLSICLQWVFNQVGQLLPFPLILTIHQRQLLFLGHILRKPDKKKPIARPLFRVPNKEFLPSPKKTRRAIQHRGQCRHLILVADGSFAVGLVEDRLEAHHSKKVRERKHLIARVPLLSPSPYLREISFPNPASTPLCCQMREISSPLTLWGRLPKSLSAQPLYN